MIRIWTLTFFLLACSYGSFAQTDFEFSKKQVAVWELAKKSTLQVAEAMPADKYGYKPNDQVKSFGGQMVHIANSMVSMHTRFILKKPYMVHEKDASNLSKETIMADLVNAFDKVIATLKTMSDEELQEQGKPHGSFPLTKWQSYLFMRDHITNHRSKAVLYLRLSGISPPPYGFN